MPDRIYLDANAFIEAIERIGPVAEALVELLDTANGLVTSEMTLSEVLVGPLRDGRINTAISYEETVASRPELDVVPVDRVILVRGAELRARTKSLKLPDAIHVATAERAGCSHFLSNDQRIVLPAPMILVPIDPALIRSLSGTR